MKDEVDIVHDLVVPSAHSHEVSAGRIGNFVFSEDPRITEAIQAFGKPSSAKKTTLLKGDFYSCTVEWKHEGIYALFYMKYEDPCAKGYFCAAAIESGDDWHTDGGLELGDSISELRSSYPDAKRLSSAGQYQWWHVEDGNTTCSPGFPWQDKPEEQSGLYAETRGERVETFTVFYYNGPVAGAD
jgi:hypothetical protein